MASVVPSRLNAHLGYWLRYLSNSVHQSFARALAGKDVTVAEWVVMRELFDDAAMAPSQLADRLGMTRGAITKLADRLITKGLVVRRSNPSDGRAQTLGLTSAGRKLVPVLATLADRNDAAFFGHMSAKKQALLKRMLAEIVRHHDLKVSPID